MGPEHSSARLERFLQLSAENAWRIVYPTTPAQYVRLLLRQVLSEPKPLIVMSPKSLLRDPKVRSSLEEIRNPHFDEVIMHKQEEPRFLLWTSGKMFCTLKDLVPKHVLLLTLEQLYPFPEAVSNILAKYPLPCYWIQEEPQNQGAWSYVQDQWPEVITYIGPPAASAPAPVDSLYKQIMDEVLLKVQKLLS
jgi:2-oxoglutarate dehydrogenase E1 component